MKNEEPTINASASGLGDIYEHPAFGCVSFSRTSGGSGTLFMSNVQHNHQIRLRIERASMARQFHHDTHYAGENLIEVTMSQVQFAELMAGMNQGSGVPCTLTRVNQKPVPGISMETTNKRFSKETDEVFEKLAHTVNCIVSNTRDALTGAKVSKAAQAAILAPLSKLAQDLGSNIPFMHDQFRESMEKVVSEAKSVVESYAISKGLEQQGATLAITNEG
jgi:hypothetical protein